VADASAQRLRALGARLEQNAYDAPALFERLVLLCAAGDRAEACKLFGALAPFLGPAPATATLQDLVLGTRDAHHRPPVYSLGEIAVPNETLRAASRLGVEIAETLGIEPPVLLFDVRPEPRTPTYAVRLVNGFGLIVTSASSTEGGGATALLAHEIAHCALATGHPFLDEGLATFFERRHGRARRPAGTPARSLPSLRALLQPELELVLRQAADPDHVQRIYDRGAAFVEWALAERPPGRLTAFFRSAVFSLSRGTLAPDLERCFEIRLERLDRILEETPHATSDAV
jgi:hypothetical protein